VREQNCLKFSLSQKIFTVLLPLDPPPGLKFFNTLCTFIFVKVSYFFESIYSKEFQYKVVFYILLDFFVRDFLYIEYISQSQQLTGYKNLK